MAAGENGNGWVWKTGTGSLRRFIRTCGSRQHPGPDPGSCHWPHPTHPSSRLPRGQLARQRTCFSCTVWQDFPLTWSHGQSPFGPEPVETPRVTHGLPGKETEAPRWNDSLCLTAEHGGCAGGLPICMDLGLKLTPPASVFSPVTWE